MLYSSAPLTDLSRIYIQKVNQVGNETIGDPVRLIHADRPDERSVNEAPTLIKCDSKYFLFFSASAFINELYFVNYAVSSNITGPYMKAEKSIMDTQFFNGTILGPGGEDVVTGEDGEQYIFYHGWDKELKRRMLFVNHLEWGGDGKPLVGADVIFGHENREVT